MKDKVFLYTNDQVFMVECFLTKSTSETFEV